MQPSAVCSTQRSRTAKRDVVVVPIPLDDADDEVAPPKAPQRQLPWPAILVLVALMYMAVVILCANLSSTSTLSSSNAWMWLLCVPYVALMTKKMLQALQPMLAIAVPESTEAEDGNTDGPQERDETLAVVGDVCIYVVGLLLLCLFVIPWKIHVDN